MKNNKGIASIVIILIIVGVLAAGGYYFWSKNSQKQVACTEEAKICPDGSSVGRTGPSCEFTECPIEEYNHAGVIVKNYQKNGKNYLDIDFIKFINSNNNTPIIYGANDEKGDCSMGPDGYCTVNNDKTVKSYEVSENVEIITAYPTATPHNPISYDELVELRNSPQSPSYFRLKIEGNIIEKMWEIYMP